MERVNSFEIVLCAWGEVGSSFIFFHMNTTAGFPGGSAGKESTYNVGELGSIPGLGRSTGEGRGYTPVYRIVYRILQYSGLENFMDRGSWRAIVHATMGSQRVRYKWAANAFQNSSCNLGSSKTLKNVPFSPLRYRNNVLNVLPHLCNSIQLTFIYFYIHLTIEQHKS